ncbi:MAG TPA: RNA methyltransferase [Vicinamibacterales bacterium]|nr:RNA methyltransferase [Vicinamibacterales bacterium]
MAVERVHDAGDPRVAGYRAVRDGELLHRLGLFVAEGRHIARRVIEDDRYRIESLLVNDAALNGLEPVLGRLGADVPIFTGSQEMLAAVAGYDVHRGCLALVHRPAPLSIDAVAKSATMLLVLEGVSNPDNVGGIFRNAAAFGAGGVVLSPSCCDPLYRKAIRTSMGAALRVPFARVDPDDWPDALMRLEAAGFATVALTPREPSETLDAFAARPRAARVAVILGTEGAGLTPAVETAADFRVRIPISSEVDSLNVAVAAAIALRELGRFGLHYKR